MKQKYPQPKKYSFLYIIFSGVVHHTGASKWEGLSKKYLSRICCLIFLGLSATCDFWFFLNFLPSFSLILSSIYLHSKWYLRSNKSGLWTMKLLVVSEDSLFTASLVTNSTIVPLRRSAFLFSAYAHWRLINQSARSCPRFCRREYIKSAWCLTTLVAFVS